MTAVPPAIFHEVVLPSISSEGMLIVEPAIRSATAAPAGAPAAKQPDGERDFARCWQREWHRDERDHQQHAVTARGRHRVDQHESGDCRGQRDAYQDGRPRPPDDG